MLDMLQIMTKLVDQTGLPIQCGYEKGAIPKFLKFAEAIETPFIRFGNSRFIPALSLDIDNHKDIKKVLDTCLEHNLHYPTVILETQKGLHLHWVLNNPLNLSNPKAKYFYQQIISALAKTFDTDTRAVPKNAGRLFRNPLKHPAEIYNGILLHLSDFSEHTKLYKSITKNPKSIKRVSKFTHYKKPDFSKVPEGERNATLFDYGRTYAYRHAKVKNLREHLISKLEKANNLIKQPLNPIEVSAIASSIMHFIQQRYVGKTTNKKTVEFNQQLAKKSYDKMGNLMLDIFFSKPLLTIQDLRNMSMRRGAQVFGIHKNTYKKHLKALINDIKTASEIKEPSWQESPMYTEAFTYQSIAKPLPIFANTT